MKWFKQAVEIAGELICVATLSAVLAPAEDGNETREREIVDAVKDFGREYADSRSSWLVRAM